MLAKLGQAATITIALHLMMGMGFQTVIKDAGAPAGGALNQTVPSVMALPKLNQPQTL